MADAATESTVPPEVLKTFTDALTSSLGSAMATTSSSGGNAGSGIQVMVGTAQNGFALNVVYDTTTYGVSFGIGDATGVPWKVTITRTLDKGTEEDWVTFTYNTKDSTWHLKITTPEIPIGGVTIKAISIEMGTTPPKLKA
jgi:hypothetical protein